MVAMVRTSFLLFAETAGTILMLGLSLFEDAKPLRRDRASGMWTGKQCESAHWLKYLLASLKFQQLAAQPAKSARR